MPGIRGALPGPIDEAPDLLGRQLLAVLGRRHDLVRVFGADSLDQLALVGLAPDDREVAAEVGERPFLGVEPKRLADAFPLAGVGAVAGIAAVGEDRPDLAVEVDRPG